MELVGHDLRPSTHSLDGHGVDLEEILRVDGIIVLLRDTWPEHGGPVNLHVRSEGPAPSPVGVLPAAHRTVYPRW
jgi:hypothetical protein